MVVIEGLSQRQAAKALAEHSRYIKYTQLNSDVFTSIVNFGWYPMVEEYRRYKQVEGLVEASLYEIQLTLRNSKRIVGLGSSKGITQQAVDGFVLKVGEEVVHGGDTESAGVLQSTTCE